MKTKAIFVLTILFGALGLAQAQAQQSDWKWPEDKAKAMEKNVLYTDSKTMGNYREAANHLRYLLIHAPDLNPAIYIDGAEIYNELAEKAKDPAKKTTLQDSALAMYDLRIKYFGNEADVLDRKAFYAYRYAEKNNKEEVAELYDLLNKVVQLKGNETSFPNAVAFMDVIRRHKKMNKALTDEQVLEKYDTIIAILDSYIAKGGNGVETIKKYKAQVEDMLLSAVDVNCDFVQTNFGPRLKENPEDPAIAKKVLTLLRAAECTDSPLFATALTTVYKSEPTYELAKYFADQQLAQKNYSEAEKYYEEAIKLTDEPAKKAEIYFDLAQTYGKLGRKSESRSWAYKAMEADPGIASKAYTHIGNLYMGSQECYQQQSIMQDRAIYLAAYKMYQKAGNTSGMARAAKEFPSAAEIFDENKNVGDQITVGCWINETVTLQKR